MESRTATVDNALIKCDGREKSTLRVRPLPFENRMIFIKLTIPVRRFSYTFGSVCKLPAGGRRAGGLPLLETGRLAGNSAVLGSAIP